MIWGYLISEWVQGAIGLAWLVVILVRLHELKERIDELEGKK